MASLAELLRLALKDVKIKGRDAINTTEPLLAVLQGERS